MEKMYWIFADMREEFHHERLQLVDEQQHFELMVVLEFDVYFVDEN
jgi:hypothetical protein